MKNIQNKLFIFLVIILVSPSWGNAQEDFTFEVNRVYPYISITKEDLKEAKSIAGLNKFYKPSWVREYLSVEISTSHNGKVIKSLSKNDTLSEEQKKLIETADVGEDIFVLIKYMPENTLKHNDPKEHDFTFVVDPDKEAEYPGGAEQLNAYLKEKAINHIPTSNFQKYDLTAIEFSISEQGEVINAQVFNSAYQSFEDEKINQLLLNTVSAMPCWTPAEYANGTKVKQKFVLTVGNMNSCIVPLLNIRSEKLSDQ